MDFPKLIEAVGVLAWPVLAAVVLWRLFPLAREIAKSRGFTVKIGDMELTVQEASEQLRVQLEDLQKKVADLRSGIVAVPQPAPLAPPLAAPTATAPHILWVDDKPENNAFEIARLRDAGVAVSEARTTDEAIRLLTTGAPIQAVITDMGRLEAGSFRSRAGLDLIRAARVAGITVPMFVYSSRQAAARTREEVIAAGGNGATASTVELFELLREATGVAA
jgi:CheY-like chemotaxis protein